MWATCYTDASWHPETGGTWAVWLRSDRGRIVRRGACPDYVKQSSEAELAAIFAGVHLAIEAWKPELRGVFVRSDALDVVHLLHGKSRIRSPAMRRLHARLSELTEQHGVAISARWVKGHRNPKSGTSAFLNAACDRLAGQLRRAKRPRG